jgi:scavenger mRNA decapping enzyme DcpS-like protein
MIKLRSFIASLLILSLGILIGGYLFSRSQPRSFLAINRCQKCLSPRDLAGLLASVGIQRFSALIPVIFETDRTVVIKNPFPEGRIDYVIIPKKDIKNVGELSEEESSYLIDAYAVIAYLIMQQKLDRYYVLTNGPGLQKVTYLHFHLIAE